MTINTSILKKVQRHCDMAMYVVIIIGMALSRTKIHEGGSSHLVEVH